MSGHSKWHSIRHKKAAIDAKRGKIFTKIIRELTLAARLGGGDIEANPRLRLAVQKAKEANMPADNIDRAIKKGTGELEGVSYEECTYEGYGPEGVAVMIDTLTDNRNRIVAELRKIMSKQGGNLGEAGCVSWIFDRKGLITVPKKDYKEDEFFELAIELGASDFNAEDDEEYFMVYTEPDELEIVRSAFVEKDIEIDSSDLTRVPKNTVKLNEEKSQKVLNLIDVLEEHDDVQSVHVNLEVE